MSPLDPKRFLSTNAVEERYGLKARTVRALCEAGVLEHYRQPGTHAHFMVYAPALVKYLQGRGQLPSLNAEAQS